MFTMFAQAYTNREDLLENLKANQEAVANND